MPHSSSLIPLSVTPLNSAVMASSDSNSHSPPSFLFKKLLDTYQQSPTAEQSHYQDRRQWILEHYDSPDSANQRLVLDILATEGRALLFCRWRLVEVMQDLAVPPSHQISHQISHQRSPIKAKEAVANPNPTPLRLALPQLISAFQSYNQEWEDEDFSSWLLQLDPDHWSCDYEPPAASRQRSLLHQLARCGNSHGGIAIREWLMNDFWNGFAMRLARGYCCSFWLLWSNSSFFPWPFMSAGVS